MLAVSACFAYISSEHNQEAAIPTAGIILDGAAMVLSPSRILTVLVVASLSLVSHAEPPNAPQNLLPTDGATDVPSNPQLCARVVDPQGLPLEVRFFARDLGAAPEEPFAIVALPDSQYYPLLFPEVFLSQIRWIVENREAMNIVFVTHEGDVVQIGDQSFEWDNAEAAMSLLEDPILTELPDGIPYGISVGNHDQHPNNQAGYPEDQSTTAMFNQYFGIDRFAGRSYFGGHFGTNNDNSYQLFTAGGMDFIIVHHEFDNSFLTMIDDVLAWTDQLLKDHRDRRAIITSHSLLCTVTACPSTLWAEFSDQGQLTYDALKDNDNLFLMLCGHAGDSYQQPRRSDTWNGHTIHTLMANYQRGEDCPHRCGNGWLRLMTFSPADDEIHVQTYSPWLDEYRSEPCLDGSSCHDFTLPYDMEGGIQFQLIGSLSDVPSNTDACIPLSGLQPGGEHEWYVDVSNGAEWTTGQRWNFSSNGSCSSATDCEDGNPCTTDGCETLTCARVPLPDCCQTDQDCDDDNFCTDDICTDNECSHIDHSRACSDQDPCTSGDVCEAGSCVGVPLACDDGNACTTDSCLDGDCVFSYQPQATCCLTSDDCNDGNPCTLDTCDGSGDCLNDPIPDCCFHAGDCDDGDVCTTDACLRNLGAFRFAGLGDYAFVSPFLTEGTSQGLNAREFTLECWFKWDGGGLAIGTSGWPYQISDTGGITAYPLITKGFAYRDDIPGGGVNYFLGIDESGVLAADLEEYELGAEPGRNRPVRGETPISVDVWHHAAVTYDGQCWQLYLDGQPDTDGANCPGVVPEDQSLFLTALGSAIYINGWVQGGYSGLLDEVRIWNRALEHEEIMTNMNVPISRAPYLMGRWALDELDSSVFSDSTGNNMAGGGAVGITVETSDFPILGDGTCHHTDVCDACPNDPLHDIDSDTICGDVDNCPTIPNSGQQDADSDGHGDLCDVCPSDPLNDTDSDTICGSVDNCPNTPNSGQQDADSDGRGDPCDATAGVAQLKRLTMAGVADRISSVSYAMNVTSTPVAGSSGVCPAGKSGSLGFWSFKAPVDVPEILRVGKTPGGGDGQYNVELTWTGRSTQFAIYRSNSPIALVGSGNLWLTTSLCYETDENAHPFDILFYIVID
jgi:hypothetical protein